MATATSGRRAQRSPVSRTNPFHRRLGSLTYHQACQLLGDDGPKKLRDGGRAFEIQGERDVFLGGDLFRVRVEDASLASRLAVVTITLQSARAKQLQTNCDCGDAFCLHLGAALDYLLDAKSVLGLAQPPDESVALENLTQQELHVRAIAEREKRAAEESMTVRSTAAERPWTDYLVTSAVSGKTYRVALRGFDAGQSYCSCPDFRTNGLGTCKHIMHTLVKVQKRFSSAKLRAPYYRRNLSLRVDYFEPVGLRFNLPTRADEQLLEIVGQGHEQNQTDAALDMASDVESVTMVSGIADLRQRLEKILTPKPDAPVDESQQRRVEAEAEAIRRRREGVAAATGQLVGAALALAGQLLQRDAASEPDPARIEQLTQQLASMTQVDEQGRPQITISLPDQQALRGIAATLARLLQ